MTSINNNLGTIEDSHIKLLYFRQFNSVDCPP